jgi:acetyl esterase/lipase
MPTSGGRLSIGRRSTLKAGAGGLALTVSRVTPPAAVTASADARARHNVGQTLDEQLHRLSGQVSFANKIKHKIVRAIVATPLLLGALIVGAPAEAQVQPDGTVHVAVDVPISSLLSPEAHASVRRMIVDRPFAGGPTPDQDIRAFRQHQDQNAKKLFLDPLLRRYAVKIRHDQIAGVNVDVVTPAGSIAPRNRHRLLLNLHGGGFVAGGGIGGQIESVPISATMGITVITIDYREGPEFAFPAASEDVAAVYGAMLKKYRPLEIGIYGCSAGGILTGETVAWLRAHHMPRPGAIGIFCASLGPIFAGDSGYLAGPLNGEPPARGNGAPPSIGYLAHASLTDPLAYPQASKTVLKAFPPTLFVTALRAFELSAAVNSHRMLVDAGVDAELHVWDGLGHAFFVDGELPESREVYRVVGRFFDKHLAP